MVRCQVLSQYSLSLHRFLEGQSQAIEMTEYAIRPRRVSDRQTHVTCRHIPRVANLSAFLRCNCDCTIREPCCEHERFITLRSYLRQLDIAAKTSRRALPYSRPD